MSIDPADTFRQEARELLEQLEEQLLDLEKTPTDDNLINAAFRALHTIKGSGAMFGFLEVASFVHEFETAFDRVRKGQSVATPDLISIALAAKDHVHKLIQSPDEPVGGGEEIVAALRAITETDAFPEPPMAEAPSETVAPAPKTSNWRIRFGLPEDCLIDGTNPLSLLDELRDVGPCTITAVTDAVPPLEACDPDTLYLKWQVDLEIEDPHAAIEDVFMFVMDGMDLSVEPLAGEDANASPAVATASNQTAPEPSAAPQEAPARVQAASEPAEPETAAAAPAESKRAEVKAKDPAPVVTAKDASGAAKPSSSLRVAAERLDELMDRVGELVIAQSRLSQMAAGSSDINLKAISEELERLSSGLRDTTMGIRMVPIGSLFGRFRRLVHDLSRDLDKDIEFVTTGEETELDKTMIERLADPLVHLIRNAVDHGLEPEDARAAAGKPKKGTVRLSAVYAGAEVAISVTDDGAGLDPARIRAKAEEAGLLAADAKIGDQDLNMMIFAPGFSTAKEVTSLSGRGVGMDVVKRTIDGLRGNIELSSEKGTGTTVTLRLPLTLAIIDGMLVRVGTGRYTIPLSAVVECVETPEAVETRSRGRNFLDIRGELVPFISLREMFAVSGEPETFQKVVIVQCGEEKIGLVVDQIIGNNQTVIKQLSKLHSGLKAFSGATILGDGTVALILDTVNLVNMGQSHAERSGVDNRGRAA